MEFANPSHTPAQDSYDDESFDIYQEYMSEDGHSQQDPNQNSGSSNYNLNSGIVHNTHGHRASRKISGVVVIHEREQKDPVFGRELKRNSKTIKIPSKVNNMKRMTKPGINYK